MPHVRVSVRVRVHVCVCGAAVSRHNGEQTTLYTMNTVGCLSLMGVIFYLCPCEIKASQFISCVNKRYYFNITLRICVVMRGWR